MVVATINKNHYKTELIASGKMILADEPEDVGGSNLGPSPGELLMMSLASCTAITLRMYADRKNWPLDQIRVEVSFEKQTDKTLFQREVFLEGNLDEVQRQKLLQIANACPVHKVLINPVEIITKLN